MIQINLLPDIKAAYVNAQRTKRLVIGISVITIVGTVTFVGLLAGIAFGAQKIQLNSAQEAISQNVSKLDETQDLDKILTIQNQLLELTPLHDSKPVVSRLFGYLQQTTPMDVQMDSYTIDFKENKITISGNANSLESINRYVDTLKFTEYSTAVDGSDPARAFSNVVLSSFSATGGRSTYGIDLTYDEALFNSSNTSVVLKVPTLTTTRSQTQLPTALFVPAQEGAN